MLDDVEVDGNCGSQAARNIWYVCTETRKKRHESGMTGSPRRRVRFWSPNALV